ncbi:MAG: glycine cleavage system aminomethyltransferase GcvT [Chloroflexota bacterium]
MEKRTPLYQEHVQAGARVVPFAGFLMPIQYTGIIDEHMAVRTGMGMFDLSHMGEFEIRGDGAADAIDYLMTNDIRGLEAGQVRYTPMLYPHGGIVDDLLVYRRSPDHFMLVVNASNIEKDTQWIAAHLPPGVTMEDVSDDVALIAIQGPEAESLLQGCTEVNLAEVGYYRFVDGLCAGVRATISRTGYTGEDGFELYVDHGDAVTLWRALWKAGADRGLKRIGLGARDTLRLEAGLMLYGNDIDQTTNPLAAGLGWTVKFGEHDFIGRETLERQKAEGLPRRMVAVEALDRAIPRAHFRVLRDQTAVGEFTSGTFSPTLGKGIGLAYIDAQFAKPGTIAEVLVRDQSHPVRITRKPMYRRNGA